MTHPVVSWAFAAAVAVAATACRPPTPPETFPARSAVAPSPAPSPERPEVRLQVSPSTPVIGDSVQVFVLLDGGKGVFSVPFHLTFDPAVLRFDGAKEGAWLRSDGRPTTFLSALSSPGRVVIGISRLGSVGGLTGGGEICTLRFTAVGAGNARLAFDRSGVVNPRGETVEASFVAAPLSVRASP